jgi:ubiquinone/menaquinone biosynthesis C-methylase UbiE
LSEPASRDKWAEWVLARRHADDAEQKRRALEFLGPIRDRVLENARVRLGEVVLDVGAGDGLIAFGAMPLVEESGRVVFCDVSQDLLDHCRNVAKELGVTERAEFVRAAAENLSPIPDGSVDVVTTRSVLIYVQHKDAAFHEFHRVLRPGGRVSIFEPINNYFPDDMDDFSGFDAHPVRDLVEKIWVSEGRDAANHPMDPMMNFNERDLLRHAETAGFAEVHVELVIDVEPGTWVEDWDRLLGTSPNPNARTTAEAIAAALTREEAERFEAHLRPLVDAGRGLMRSAFAYLWAVKSTGDTGRGS